MQEIQIGAFENGDSRPLSELAYEIILTKIIRLDIKPGDALVEKALMVELGFGRTPIREALQRLANEGLICREHYRGVYACEITADSTRDVVEFLKMSDPLIARLAAERASRQEVEGLEACVARMRELVKSKRCAGVFSPSREFFALLGACTHNAHLEETAKRLHNFDARLFYLACQNVPDGPELAKERLTSADELVNCVKRSDGEQAEAVMRLYHAKHFGRIQSALSAILDRTSGILTAR